MADEKIVNFIKKLLILSELVKPNDEFDEDYVNNLSLELEKRLGYAAMRELNPENLDEYVNLVAENKSNPQVSFEFFKKNIPDFEKKMQTELNNFAIDFVERTAKMREALS